MKFNLIRLSLFALICLLSVSTVMATPACPFTTLASGIGSPASYENADGSPNGYVCDIGNLEFSNFTSGTAPVKPNQINVLPGYQTPPNTNPGFEFTGPFFVGPGGVTDVFISFTVTALTGMLTDVHILLNNSLPTGDGFIRYSEQVCTPVNGSPSCRTYVDDYVGAGNLTAEILLDAPAKSINITKDLYLSGGSNGSASVTAFSNYYSQTVPEPRAVSALLGLGFIGIMAFMKRRQSVRS